MVGPALSSMVSLIADHNKSNTSSSSSGKPNACVEHKKYESQRSAIATIEVCQGPDCFGSGGGAAILELEDLAQHYYSYDIATTSSSGVKAVTTKSSSSSLKVIAGGCRNFCSMGPNVHLYDEQGNHQHHLTKIQSTQACYTVVDRGVAEHRQRHDCREKNCVAGEDQDTTGHVSSSSVLPIRNNNGGIMMQRAEKKRWTFLRKVARAKVMHQSSNHSQRKQERIVAELLGELECVIAAEVSAARGNTDAVERAERRKQHLETTLKNTLVIQVSKGVQ